MGSGWDPFGPGGPYPQYPRQAQDNAGVRMLQQEVIDLRDVVAQVQSSPATLGAVVNTYGDGPKFVWLTVSLPNQMIIDVPITRAQRDQLKIARGDCVKLANNDKGALVFAGIEKKHNNTGPIAQIKQVLSRDAIEIDLGPSGGARIVACEVDSFAELKPGSRVVLDRGIAVVVGQAHESTKTPFSFERETGVTWADIGGLEEAKRTLIEAIELPSKHPEIYKAYGKKPIKGVLLFGPAGCIAGDAIIQYNRGGCGRQAKLSDFVSKYNGGSTRSNNGLRRWEPDTETRVRCRTEDGFIRSRAVSAAVYSGRKLTYALKTDGGFSVRATADHQFLTQDGWVALQDLSIGDQIHVDKQERGRGTVAKAKNQYKVRNGLPDRTHKKEHAINGGWKDVSFRSSLDQIISIDRYEVEDVFDIGVADDAHNFLANGIVVHNCGKTLLAKAACTAHNGAFFYVAGPSIVDKYIGVGEEKVRSIFSAAREHEKRTGAPAMIFLDEADAILSMRQDDMHHEVERRMVPAFLAEMDGLESSRTIVLIATNRPYSLDPAITRDGRIDRSIVVPRPGLPAVAEIFRLRAKNVKIAKGHDLDTIIDRTCELIFSDASTVQEYKLPTGSVTIRLRDLISGAMVEGIIDQATSVALHRDIDAALNGPATLPKVTAKGVTSQDFDNAIVRVIEQNKSKNHVEEIATILASQQQ